MASLLNRLFLLLQLGFDWAADPSLLAPAVQLTASPLASTECLSPAEYSQADMRNSLKCLLQPPCPQLLPPITDPRHALDREHFFFPDTSPTELLYLFRSLQR